MRSRSRLVTVLLPLIAALVTAAGCSTATNGQAAARTGVPSALSSVADSPTAAVPTVSTSAHPSAAPSTAPPPPATTVAAKPQQPKPKKPIAPVSAAVRRGAQAEGERLVSALLPGLAGSGWVSCTGHTLPFTSSAQILIPQRGTVGIDGVMANAGMLAGHTTCSVFKRPTDPEVLITGVREFAGASTAAAAALAYGRFRRNLLSGPTQIQLPTVHPVAAFAGRSKQFEQEPAMHTTIVVAAGRLLISVDYSVPIDRSQDGGIGQPTIKMLDALTARITKALNTFHPTEKKKLATLNPDPAGLLAMTIPSGTGGPSYLGGRLGAFPVRDLPAVEISDDEEHLMGKFGVDQFALGGVRLYRTSKPTAAKRMGPRLFELIRTDPDLAATPVAVSAGIPGTSCFTAQEQSGTVFACVGTVQRYVFLYAVEVPLASHPNVQTNMRGPLALQAARLPKAP